jgi:hypothetical protein
MKASGNKRTARPESAVFPQALHRLRPNPKAAPAGSNSPARDKVFSKSRDTREDRGQRQMKTSHNAQTIPHAH